MIRLVKSHEAHFKCGEFYMYLNCAKVEVEDPPLEGYPRSKASRVKVYN
jgi:hypothetical protein